MPIFGPSPLLKYRPKAINFSGLYSHATRYQSIPPSLKPAIKGALKKGGLNESEIGRIIESDQPITVQKMKEITAHLAKNKIHGFDRDPWQLVNEYVKKETAKARNLARVRQEHAREVREEDQKKASANRPLAKPKKPVRFPF